MCCEQQKLTNMSSILEIKLHSVLFLLHSGIVATSSWYRCYLIVVLLLPHRGIVATASWYCCYRIVVLLLPHSGIVATSSWYCCYRIVVTTLPDCNHEFGNIKYIMFGMWRSPSWSNWRLSQGWLRMLPFR